MKVAIIGAGMTGLTTALSLHAAGIDCVVFEAAPKLAPMGVGINVLPHAMRELTALGMLEDLRAAGVEIDELVYLTKYGERIWEEPRGLAAGYKWPQIAIHRGELQMVLLRAVQKRLGADAVCFDHTLADIEIQADGVLCHFNDHGGKAHGAPYRADIVAAADGIHSAARRKFYPNEGAPSWNGVVLWRSVSETGKVLGGRSMLWAGHARQKFVGYPIRYNEETGATLLNWICELRVAEQGAPPPKDDWNRKGERADFLPPFEGWRWTGVDVPDIVNTSSEIYVFPMADRDPLPRWTFGRLTLLGDAAHPMYPVGSNGATQGIIDARAFAYHLATAPSTDAALAAYEGERRPVTERIVLSNRANGPDNVMELADQRAPNKGDNLDVLLPHAERQAIADNYKKVAGFDPALMTAPSKYIVKR